MFRPNGEEIPWEEVSDDIQLIPAGDGIYQVTYPVNGAIEYLVC
jgi:hypothetical protein